MKRVVASASLVFVACGPGSPDAASPASAAEIAVAIPKEPSVARWDGRRHLVWEIVVENPSRDAIEVASVEIDAGAFGKKRFVEDELRARVKASTPVDVDAVADLRIAAKPPRAEPREIPAGGTAAIFVRVQNEDDAELPAQIHHVVTFRAGESTITRAIDVAPARVEELVLAAPLRGAGWFAADAPTDTAHHRRTMFRFHGAWHLGQRFAIDFNRIGSDGGVVKEGAPSDRNDSYLAWGQTAYAVADATVVAIHDGVAENAGDSGMAAQTPITVDNVSGNSIVLDLGGGRFAGYAHLRPGSLRVAMGDRVKRGQELALVGNSGNSGGPHLHFQVCDAPSFLVCEGTPFAFESFEHTPLGDTFTPIGKPERVQKQLFWTHHAIDFGT
ncbi:MAG TPA: M23 family metallopeptidase [Labilithrix sp.]